jgi:hypothetical protein
MEWDVGKVFGKCDATYAKTCFGSGFFAVNRRDMGPGNRFKDPIQHGNLQYDTDARVCLTLRYRKLEDCSKVLARGYFCSSPQDVFISKISAW